MADKPLSAELITHAQGRLARLIADFDHLVGDLIPNDHVAHLAADEQPDTVRDLLLRLFRADMEIISAWGPIHPLLTAPDFSWRQQTANRRALERAELYVGLPS